MIISAPEWGYNSCVDLFLFRMFEAGSLLSLEPRTLLVERGFNLSESIWRALIYRTVGCKREELLNGYRIDR